jgi:hypothetical protein
MERLKIILRIRIWVEIISKELLLGMVNRNRSFPADRQATLLANEEGDAEERVVAS